MEPAIERPAAPAAPRRPAGASGESPAAVEIAPTAPGRPARPGRFFRARGLSLRVRLLMLVLMSVVPTIVVLAILHVVNTQAAIEAECVARGEAAARSLDGWLARNVARAKLDEEVDFLLLAHNGVRHIAVFLRRDPDRLESLEAVASDRPLREIQPRSEAEYEAADRDRMVLQTATSRGDDGELERYYDITAPLHGVLSDGRWGPVGAANIEVSLAEPDRRIARLRNSFIAVALAALLVTAATLILSLHRAIGEPTGALVAAMERARRGDLHAQAPADRLDEFGWLAENFNRLLKRVREVDEVLHSKVEAATAELASKNDELVRANERLFETERSVSRLERLASLGQLASTIAHEVGTPLNAIYGHVQLMRQDPVLLEKHGERLSVIESQIERLTTTIQGVLTDLRAPEMRFDPTDLNAVVRELAALTGAAVAARSVRLELALAADLPKVLADRAQLSQVFVNLLTNALDAMPAGGRIRIETRRGTLGDGARPDGRAGRKVAGLPAEPAEPGGEPAVAVEFYDSGVGIAPDDVKRVFEPFYSTKALGHGTGLGLAICHQVVKRHSGTITVTSEPGKGSTFLVLLPRPATGGTRA